jgi:hypothetical protein
MEKKQNITVHLCARCRHPESDHGKTGSRPCMAVIGELGKREFCPCDKFCDHAALAA